MERQTYEQALRALLETQKVQDVRDGLLRGSFVRAVNFHATLAGDRSKFERQLESYARIFSNVTVEDLDLFLDTGIWHKEKPGLIPAVFEGFRDQYDVMVPLLEAYGLIGWFHIPSFYPDVPVAEQASYGDAHQLHAHPGEYADGRCAMNWDEIRYIARRHVLCCHSGSHFQIHPDTSDEDMEREIVQAKIHLERMAEAPCRVYCWLYGEEFAYNPRAAEYIRKAGFRYVVGNLKIERVAR